MKTTDITEASPKRALSFLWNLFCISSIIGIWPRFIEPNLICTTKLNLDIPQLPDDLEGLKILQISDLHFSSHISSHFLDRLVKKAKNLNPDLIVFTGDFLCYGKLTNKKKLEIFLNRFHARYGCYAILGNHDYSSGISINKQGDYDIVSPPSSSLLSAFTRLLSTKLITGFTTDQAKRVPLNEELLILLKKTPFKLLHNQTETIPIKGTKLNICGLGEYSSGKCLPEQAFHSYDKNYPGIILLHNPDGSPLLKTYPGDIILSGHTHGGQVNLPWFWKKFTLLENMKLKKGLIQNDNKTVYINRGLGGVLSSRWFSPPEILLLTLGKKSCKEKKLA